MSNHKRFNSELMSKSRFKFLTLRGNTNKIVDNFQMKKTEKSRNSEMYSNNAGSTLFSNKEKRLFTQLNLKIGNSKSNTLSFYFKNTLALAIPVHFRIVNLLIKVWVMRQVVYFPPVKQEVIRVLCINLMLMIDLNHEYRATVVEKTNMLIAPQLSMKSRNVVPDLNEFGSTFQKTHAEQMCIEEQFVAKKKKKFRKLSLRAQGVSTATGEYFGSKKYFDWDSILLFLFSQ